MMTMNDDVFAIFHGGQETDGWVVATAFDVSEQVNIQRDKMVMWSDLS